MKYMLIITFLDLNPIYGSPYQELHIVGNNYTNQECSLLGEVFKTAVANSETKTNFKYLCIGIDNGWF